MWSLQHNITNTVMGGWQVVCAVICVCFAVGCLSVTPGSAQLEVVYPFRYALRYAPAWFGNIVLPPGRVQAKVTYAGDACESLLGRTPVRNTLALVDRGRCSFMQKAVHVEQAGGIAMIVVNDDNNYFIMTEDGTGRASRISSFLISKSDGDMLRAELVCDTSQQEAGSSRKGGGCDPDSQGLYIGWGLNFQPKAHYRVV